MATTPRGTTADTDFERIVEAHSARVYRTILSLVRDPGEAEALTQETFGNVYRRLAEFRGEASLATWVLRIARNVALDHLRRRARRREDGRVALEALEGSDLTDPEAATPEQTVERQRSDECVQACFGVVAEPYRRVLVLHDVQQLTNPEIAARLGVSLATVKIRVHRGRAQVRATFERHCEVYRDEQNELGCQPARSGGCGPAAPGSRPHGEEPS